MTQLFHKPSDLGNDDVVLKGKVIQKHLENVNMDAWYYIYQDYLNPQKKK